MRVEVKIQKKQFAIVGMTVPDDYTDREIYEEAFRLDDTKAGINWSSPIYINDGWLRVQGKAK